ncbi:MAG TPA: hypothetical protein DD490_35230 [Acidobacteria bacterium]|nr:hypothetical protein [Acidobacteriota bacterium]
MPNWMDKLRGMMKPWTTGTEPMELRRAVLDDVESRVVLAGSGKKVFPYNRLEIRLLADDPQQKEEMEAIVREAWDLRRDVTSRLRDLGSSVPAGLEVEARVTSQPGLEFGDRHWNVIYHRIEDAGPAGPARRATLELTVKQGKAQQAVYSFAGQDRITIGRLDEVLDEEGRVRRRNDIAFSEEGEINRTVSREQARIAWDAVAGEYRLRAEPGASGTRILRDGRTIEVSSQDRRGVRLLSGDEVYLGKACLKVAVRAAG